MWSATSTTSMTPLVGGGAVVMLGLLLLCSTASPSSVTAFQPFANGCSRSCCFGAKGKTLVGRWQGLPAATTTTVPEESSSSSSWFSTNAPTTVEQLKIQILQLGASLDRGQSYNPTSGDYYVERMNVARRTIQDLLARTGTDRVPKTLAEIEGEWELVFTTVKHGIFRSSPFFLAVQEAFAQAQQKEAFGEDKATLFFKLHELQTCSWGISKIGRVAQRVNATRGYLYSEFDTSIFALTVIPILGWFKLLPTFGGCVITAATCQMNQPGFLEMQVDYTTSRPVPGLNGLGEWIWNVKVPVGAIWKWLPWNKGRPATCSVQVRYVDKDFRIVEDQSGDFFVYSRPVVPRAFDPPLED